MEFPKLEIGQTVTVRKDLQSYVYGGKYIGGTKCMIVYVAMNKYSTNTVTIQIIVSKSTMADDIKKNYGSQQIVRWRMSEDEFEEYFL